MRYPAKALGISSHMPEQVLKVTQKTTKSKISEVWGVLFVFLLFVYFFKHNGTLLKLNKCLLGANNV